VFQLNKRPREIEGRQRYGDQATETKRRALINAISTTAKPDAFPTYTQRIASPDAFAFNFPTTHPLSFPMKVFGLTPQQVIDRSGADPVKQPVSLLFSILYGGIGFAVVSVLAYSIWAFRLVRGQGPMYLSIAIVYVVLSGWVMGRLVLAPKAQFRFMGLFATGFAAYAILWCLLWFGLTGKHHGDLYGSALGLLAMAVIFKHAFGASFNLLFVSGILFTFHTLGYYLGDDLYQIVGGSTGRLLWGAGHGIGFGAGLGCLIHQCQVPLATMTAEKSNDS